MATRLPNPYEGHEAQLTIRISKEDREFLFERHLSRHGARQAVVGTMVKKLVTELRNDPEFENQTLTKEEYVKGLLDRLNFLD